MKVRNEPRQKTGGEPTTKKEKSLKCRVNEQSLAN